VTGLPLTNPLRNKAFKCCLFSSSGFSKIACLGSKVYWAMPSSSSDTSKSTGAMNYFGRKTTIFMLASGLSSFPSSALGFWHQTLDRTFFLSNTCLSASSCCSSWPKQWTLPFWDLVKPSGHHCGLGFLRV
jgi:hypothetical protein